MFTHKIKDNSMAFVEHATGVAKRRAYRYKIYFWSLTLFSLFFAFFSSIMGTAKLASTRFPEHYKIITDLFVSSVNGKTVDQWPIFVLWIGVATSIISGLLALFIIRNRWISNTKMYNIIKLEKKLYDNNYGIYSDKKTRDYVLFNRVSEIIGTNKYIVQRWEANEK